MNVLILGGGGREHAVAWKLNQDDPSVALTVAPGNPGIEDIGRCVRIDPSDAAAVVSLANSVAADLVVVGPEAPLAAGVVDALRAQGIRAFGPTAAAARIEASKRFSKDLMLRAGIPTARATWHDSAPDAKRSIRSMGAPVVVKASGLAAGKGVVVAESTEHAEHAVDQMMLQGLHGKAGSEVLIEEFMSGEELSVFAITDGKGFVLLPPAQDHKRLLQGDLGPNTGGMGAYAPVSLATPELLGVVADRIIAPTLHAMAAAESPFTGLLYAGLMLTEEGPKVVEFNCRFGDPETQVVLPVMQAPLIELLRGAADGELPGSADLSAAARSAVTTVVAAAGYPESARVGDELVLPDPAPDVVVFHSGTRRSTSGGYESSGGRVLAVTGISEDFDEAARLSREHAAMVRLTGSSFRSDIGWRELARRARAS